MRCKDKESKDCLCRTMSEEEDIRQRVDEAGISWVKVYSGSGAHFRNWLDQVIELKGEENVKVEEAEPEGLQCYKESGEKMYRIWVKETATE